MQVRAPGPMPERLFHAAGNFGRLKASSVHRIGSKTDARQLGSALSRNRGAISGVACEKQLGLPNRIETVD